MSKSKSLAIYKKEENEDDVEEDVLSWLADGVEIVACLFAHA